MWKAHRPAISTGEEQRVTSSRNTYSAGQESLACPCAPSMALFLLILALTPCHPRGAVATKTNSRLVPYMLKIPMLCSHLL